MPKRIRRRAVAVLSALTLFAIVATEAALYKLARLAGRGARG
jgi:hypothetical protein